MSEETRVYQEGEAVPVPDKGGWIDGETGPVLPTPGPPAAEPHRETVDDSGRVQNPAKEPTPEPPAPKPKKAA